MIRMLSVALLLGAAPQAPDPEVDTGRSEVEAGDYPAALRTLDSAVRRLAADARQPAEQARAQLYLGIAFAGLGQAEHARAQFRSALAVDSKLTLPPKPSVPLATTAFEEARRESGPKRGSRSPLILGLAASLLAVSPVVLPKSDTSQSFSGSLGGGACEPRGLAPGAKGTLDATLSWGDSGQTLTLAPRDAGGAVIASSSPLSATSAHLTVAVVAAAYTLLACQAGGGASISYTLTVNYPR